MSDKLISMINDSNNFKEFSKHKDSKNMLARYYADEIGSPMYKALHSIISGKKGTDNGLVGEQQDILSKIYKNMEGLVKGTQNKIMFLSSINKKDILEAFKNPTVQNQALRDNFKKGYTYAEAVNKFGGLKEKLTSKIDEIRNKKKEVEKEITQSDVNELVETFNSGSVVFAVE